MKKAKPEWAWVVYFLAYWLLTTAQTVYFFSPGSLINLYYHYLIAYDLYFLLTYTFNVLAIIFNAFSLIPVYLFIYRVDFLTQDFWKTLFLLRLTFDILGRSFEYQGFKSLFHEDPWTAVLVMATFILFYIPSYAALFVYAFRPKKYYS